MSTQAFPPWAGCLSRTPFLVFTLDVSHSSPVSHDLPPPHHDEILFYLKDSGDANISTHGGSLTLFSLLMAFGQWLPALTPFLCSKVWYPKVLAHLSPTCPFHLFTHLAPESSNLGPSTSSAPFLTHSAGSQAESLPHAAHGHRLLSRGLGRALHVPRACLVPSVSMELLSHISPEEHPSHHSPAFPGLVPTSSKPATVLYAPRRFSLLENCS